MGQRHFFERGGVRISYVDFGGDEARPLVCLHGRSGTARNFAPLAQALRPARRVLGMDQRGHGWSDHADDRSRDAFIDDAAELLRRVGDGRPVALLGHSFGGVTAYQVAARHGDLVRCVIIEDVGCRFAPPGAEPSWPLRWESLDQFLAFMAGTPIGVNRFLLDSLVEYEDGWGFRFTDENYRPARAALTGDWSADWAAITCPILLVHGTTSTIVSRAEIDRMAALNPRTELAVFDGIGHFPHDEDPAGFTAAVTAFLDRHGA